MTVPCSGPWTMQRRWCARMTHTNSTWNVAVGTVKKSAATRSRAWFRRNERQVGDGGWRCQTRYLATVVGETLMPSFRSSLSMRGVPQSGLARLIFRMSAWMSGSIAGRPERRRLFRAP